MSKLFTTFALDNEPMKLSDCTSSMCNTLEAMFLHGLKDSLLRQTINVLAGGEIDRRPEPNFWPPLLVILHNETIAQVRFRFFFFKLRPLTTTSHQIQSRNQLHTDIGFCRSWIRQSLNDNILSSYVATIRRNQSALNTYYRRYAFLRDLDRLDVVERLLTGIETDITFLLPMNSSLLNQWTDQPLQMAGLYTPSLRACPVCKFEFVSVNLIRKRKIFPFRQISSGIDVASSLIEPEQRPDVVAAEEIEVADVFEEEMFTPPQQCDFNEDERLEILLQKVDAAIETEKSLESSPLVQESGSENQKPLQLDVATANAAAFSRSNSMTTSVSSMRSPIDRHSFSTLLDKHNDKCSVYSRSINLKDVWDRYQTSLFTQPTDQIECPDIDIADETPENLGFEIVNVVDNYSAGEIQKFVQLACRLAVEKGLDKQSFTCKSCPTPLGIGDATR